jgi:HAD superfamily hydrolase (TIGR01459 family)
LGKPIILLSNSGKRASQNMDRLEECGFRREYFADVVSSGEAAYWDIKAKIGTDFRKNAKVLLLSREGDTSAIDGLELSLCDTGDDADLVIISGSRGDEISLSDYERLIAPAAKRATPAICTNPDFTMLTAKGLCFGAGEIAKTYEAHGGSVMWFGKPYREIYDFALKKIPDIPRQRVLCIGDSPVHDIRGAHNAGCFAALVRTGIHAQDSLDTLISDVSDIDRPDFVIPSFEMDGE